MDGNANCARLVGNGSGNRLTDPPGGIGGKFIAFAVIKFFNGFDQAHVPLLNQVEKHHAAADIALCNTHHKPKVCLRKLNTGLLVALRHAAGQFLLFIIAQQGDAPNLLQVYLHRIIYGDPFL